MSNKYTCETCIDKDEPGLFPTCCACLKAGKRINWRSRQEAVAKNNNECCGNCKFRRRIVDGVDATSWDIDKTLGYVCVLPVVDTIDFKNTDFVLQSCDSMNICECFERKED